MATKTVIKTGCMPTAPAANGQHRGISIIIDQQQQAQPQQNNQNQQQQHQSATKIIIQQKGDDVASLPGSKNGGLVKMASDRGECILNMPQNGRGELGATTSCNISCNGYSNNSNNNTNIHTNTTTSINQGKPQCESDKERGAEAAEAKPENEKMLLDVAGKSSQTPNANGRNVLLVVGANNNANSNNTANGISITTTTTTTTTTKTLHNESNGTSSLSDNDIRGGSGSGSGSTRMIIKCSTHDADDVSPMSSTTTTTTTCESNGKRAHEESSRDHQQHDHGDHDDRQQHHRVAAAGVVTVTGRGDSAGGVGECENGQQTVDCQRLGVGVATTTAAAESQLERPPSPQRSGSLATKVDDCASAVTTTTGTPERRSAATHRASNVLTIQINRNQFDSPENHLKREDNDPSDANTAAAVEPKGKPERQVTVVSVNSGSEADPQRFFHTDLTPAENSQSSAAAMVHKAQTMAAGGSVNGLANAAPNNNNNSSVTELNVSNNSYLYYMMTSSSGQFSPCDTLDSGTGSDLESNSNGHGGGSSPNGKLLNSSLEMASAKAQSPNHATTTTSSNSNSKPNQTHKLEMHLQTTKLRLGSGSGTGAGKLKSRYPSYEEHDDADCDGDDSEECESTSSLSCDSLHSSEFNMSPMGSKGSAKGSGIPQPPSQPSQQLASMKLLSSMLPDSLLRDIRDRKFPASDFVSKYHQHSGGEESHESASSESSSAAGDKSPTHDYSLEVQEHVKFLQERDDEPLRRSLLPPGKTFHLNSEDGTFVDTKMNAMPRTYEADKFYNFHVNEHENFRSFGSGHGSRLLENFPEYEGKAGHEDAFAGYKDIRCASGTSTIRSSKGTVRGVKNRVRNGIATFLQMQQPNIKNYKEKDLGKVVLYTTSMGIIRDTYAKCANVKQILRTLLVKFEERDVFMSLEYQQEIKERMHSEIIKVPQLFVEGQHIGDAETVERLNESGELRQLLKPYKSIATTFTCQTCGGYRLLPCPSCNGSKKSVHRNHFTAEFVALKCMNCDEVGLVKCHNC